MATFLSLVQDLGKNSRGGGGSIATVTGATGREAKLVEWTQAAWRDIQLSYWPDWRWMSKEGTGTLTVAQQRHTGAELGISDFGKFRGAMNSDEDRYTLYDNSIGLSDEGQLQCYDYREFYTNKLRGVTQNARPASFAIDDDGKIVFPNLQIPDKAYKIRFPYVQEVQELTADTDEPRMPAHFHRLIVEVALVLLETHDEGPRINLFELQKIRTFNNLADDQLPSWDRPDAFV